MRLGGRSFIQFFYIVPIKNSKVSMKTVLSHSLFCKWFTSMFLLCFYLAKNYNCKGHDLLKLVSTVQSSLLKEI